MKPEHIRYLDNACQYFEYILEDAVDGNGNNLHDIKNSLDYVCKYMVGKDLTSYPSAEVIMANATDVSDRLSNLWHQINNLKNSLRRFIDSQNDINTKGW